MWISWRMFQSIMFSWFAIHFMASISLISSSIPESLEWELPVLAFTWYASTLPNWSGRRDGVGKPTWMPWQPTRFLFLVTISGGLYPLKHFLKVMYHGWEVLSQKCLLFTIIGTGIKGRDLCLWNLKLSLLLLYRNNLSLLQSFRDDSLLEMLILEARNLKEYGNTRYKHVFDLWQLARNNRGRGETKDNALCTLTTNSGKLFSKAVSVKT